MDCIVSIKIKRGWLRTRRCTDTVYASRDLGKGVLRLQNFRPTGSVDFLHGPNRGYRAYARLRERVNGNNEVLCFRAFLKGHGLASKCYLSE